MAVVRLKSDAFTPLTVSEKVTVKVTVEAAAGLVAVHRQADPLRSTLLPMDMIAWSPQEATFLALLEEIPTPEATVNIAERVQHALNKHLEGLVEGLALHTNSGVLMCDVEYKDVEKVIEDVARARAQLKKGAYPSPAVFDHNAIVTHK
jgi:hypothetical protein